MYIHTCTYTNLRFEAHSSISGRSLAAFSIPDSESISMRQLRSLVHFHLVQNECITQPQKVTLLSSSSGGILEDVLGYCWGRKVKGGLKPRRRLCKKTFYSVVALRKFFLPREG